MSYIKKCLLWIVCFFAANICSAAAVDCVGASPYISGATITDDTGVHLRYGTGDKVLYQRHEYQCLNFRCSSYTPNSGSETFTSWRDLGECLRPFSQPIRVFGQPDLKQTNFNEVVANRAFHPAGVFVDRAESPLTASKFYVWDGGNNRVLGFSTIGVCALSTSTSNTVDIVPIGKACTDDSNCGSNGKCALGNTPSAQFALGQPSTSAAGACNGQNNMEAPATDSSLCLVPYPNQKSPLEGPRGGQIAADADHNIYLVDTFNNRVLKFFNPFAVGNDTAADWQWGQKDFTTRECNQGNTAASNQTLCSGKIWGEYTPFFTSSLDVTANGEMVWVADPGNHRVLLLNPKDTPPNDKVAKQIVGEPNQGNFNNHVCEWLERQNYNQFCWPTGIAYDEASKKLYVLDGYPDDGNPIWNLRKPGVGRIVVINDPVRNGYTASNSTEWLAPVDKDFKWPRGLTLDPKTKLLWVNDTDNHRSLRYNTNGSADRVIGDCDFDPTNDCSHIDNELTDDDSSVVSPHGSIGIDQSGALYIADLNSQRIKKFNSASIGNGTMATDAGLVFNQAKGKNNHKHANHVGPSGFANPGYVTFVDSQLVVADRQRILFWNDFRSGNLVAGSASGVLGQDDFESQIGNNGDFTSLAYDNVRQRLYATHTEGVTYWSTSGGLKNRATKLGFIDTTKLKLAGGGTLPCVQIVNTTVTNKCAFVHIYLDVSKDIAWLTDGGFNRVIRILKFSSDVPGDRVVDLVVGQSKISEGICNRGFGPISEDYVRLHPEIKSYTKPNGFCQPAQTAFDNKGNLFVVDGTWECRIGNCRVVQYAASALPAPDSTRLKYLIDTVNPERVYGPSKFDNRDCGADATHLCSPRWISFDPRDGALFATGDSYWNSNIRKRIAYWQSPTPAGITSPTVTGFIDLPLNQAGNIAISSDGYMAILDHTWNRVVLYKTTVW